MNNQKKILQKVLSVLLVMVLIVGIVPQQVFADDAEETELSMDQNSVPEEETEATAEEAPAENNRIAPRSGSYSVTNGTISIGTYATLADAVAACVNGSSCTITVLADDMDMGSTVHISGNKIITLTSAGRSNITYTGTDRHLSVEGSLTLTNITLKGSKIGGGVYVNGGSLKVETGAVIQNCYGAQGGGVQITGGGHLQLNGGTITENTSDYGGGVSVAFATFHMNGGIISKNTAISGGGVYGPLNNEFVMVGGTISDNKADQDGGGVYIPAGSSFQMSNGVIDSNTAGNAGGGVYAHGTSLGALSFQAMNSTISNNKATVGGGIWGHHFEVTDSIISSNTAVCGGGIYRDTGIFTLIGSEVSLNTATADGGGIYTAGSGGAVYDACVITSNKAVNGAGMALTGSGVYELENSTIEYNTAEANGGGVYQEESGIYYVIDSTIQNNHSKDGGGIYLAGASSVDLVNGKIMNNLADDNGGGVYFAGSNGCEMDDSSAISSNTAHGNGGGIYSVYSAYFMYTGTISSNTADGNGGGIYMEEGLIEISNGSVSSNTAANGGGIYLLNGETIIDSAVLSGNTAHMNGGGIYVPKDSTLTVGDTDYSSAITDNQAGLNGGGIYTEDYSYAEPASTSAYANLDITASTVFRDNMAGNGFSAPPSNAAGFTGIKYASTSIENHILNNYDINYFSILYVNYNANNSSGAVYTDPTAYGYGDTAVILSDSSTGFTADAGYVFDYWCTMPGGTEAGGVRYEIGDLLTMDKQVSLYAIWKIQTREVHVEHVLRDGSPVPGAVNYTTTQSYGTNYVPVLSNFAGYVFVDWKLDGVTQGNTSPGVQITDNDVTITLVYGYDRNINQKEDILLTKQFQTTNGTTLLPSETKIVDIGESFQDSHTAVTGYVYQGYKVNNGNIQTGEPNIFIASYLEDGKVVTYIYQPEQYTITVKHVDENNNPLENGSYDYSTVRDYVTEFSGIAPTIAGYSYQSWKLNGTVQSGDIRIAPVTADANIVIIYKRQVNPPKTNHGNYTFKKGTNVKKVKAGETVDYTFTNFGNNWTCALEGYSIADLPDKGLDFVYANLPAFTNGAGVTYDVVYRTNLKGSITLYSSIAAGQTFSFKAPALAKGEYITGIELRFGTVPSGFAVGDEIQMGFRVWDNPPVDILSNLGMLHYSVDGEEMEFLTDVNTILDGYFTATLTNDSMNLDIWSYLLVVSGLGLISLMIFNRKKKKQISK